MTMIHCPQASRIKIIVAISKMTSFPPLKVRYPGLYFRYILGDIPKLNTKMYVNAPGKCTDSTTYNARNLHMNTLSTVPVSNERILTLAPQTEFHCPLHS